MATFIIDLWQSIFTPGPTPTLLAATNATFAALQLVLAALLYATWSVHFFVLSVLCAGLWAAINWFARELRAHQQQEEEEKNKKRRAGRPSPPPPSSLARAAAAAAGEASSDDSETEVETTATAKSSTASLRKTQPPATTATATATATAKPVAVSSVVEPAEVQGELKMRSVEELPSPSQGLRSGVSTEDEWEKVSENENEKDK